MALLAALAAVLVAMGLWRRSDGAAHDRPVLHRDDGHAVDAGSGEAPVPRFDAPMSVTERIAVPSEPPPAAEGSDTSSDDAVAELEGRLRSAESWGEMRHCLEELVGIGTPAAIAVVLEHMRTGPHHPQEPGFLAELLSDVEDPRIAGVAAQMFDASMQAGNDSWPYVGYATLLAQHGSSADRATLFGYLNQREVNTQLRMGIAESLTERPDPALAADLLVLAGDLLRSGDWATGGSIVEGMAEWRDPAISAGVLDIARDPGLDPGTRGHAYAAWGASIEEPAGLVSVIAEYRDAPHEHKGAAFGALDAAVGRWRGAERLEAIRAARPMIEEALASGDLGQVYCALTFIGDFKRDVPVDLASLLRHTYDTSSVPPDVRTQMLVLAEDIETR